MESIEDVEKTEGSTADQEPAMDRLILDPTIRATGIQVAPVLNTSGRAFVRLVVNGPDGVPLMESSQDLEDTLALGSFIVEAVGDVLKDVVAVLRDDIWREHLGADFESYLARTEVATRRIRTLLDQARE